MRIMKHIELFAGCGGLSLGLKSVGFELTFANEISPMASETFAYNHLDEDLSNKLETCRNSSKVFWLNSLYPRSCLSKRLRENPFDAPANLEGYNDLEGINDELKNGLIVGNIIDLNNYLEKNSSLKQAISNSFGEGEVDLISGGPPCQSFSMAGLREHDNHKNQLPWEFARFVNQIKPKVALLENVTGILRAFNVDGEKFYAWFEVAKAFSLIGYVPLCLHVNAKYAGVAQNRPSFMMLAFREDIYNKIEHNKTGLELALLHNSKEFYHKVKQGDEVKYGSLRCWDIEKDHYVFEDTFLSPLRKVSIHHVYTVKDAIEDLRVNGNEESYYVKVINESFGEKFGVPLHLENHELRKNTPLVKSRFRLYQVLSELTTSIKKDVISFLRNQEHKLSKETVDILLKYHYRDIQTADTVKFLSQSELEIHLEALKTKKMTQKALIENAPAPAALTIADDICHYHENEQRTLTVREMARIQSFPDSFIFRSKVTTGGKMRRYEVPQYTQVGNAVPPLLGKAIGEVIIGLMKH